MKKSIKIGAMSLLLVLLPGSLGIGTVYSSSGANTNVNEENTTYQDNNVVTDKSPIVISLRILQRRFLKVFLMTIP